jgi:hypothetical protein
MNAENDPPRKDRIKVAPTHGSTGEAIETPEEIMRRVAYRVGKKIEEIFSGSAKGAPEN